jgi:EAL domain-containing protein (putative c-di-GMP-specific phosphodiesterase class I)
MQLEPLVNLFNKRFKQERGLEHAPLHLVRGKVEARLGELRLASKLQPVRRADTMLIVQGQDALLRAYVEGGTPSAALDVFSEADGASVVNLDRLCRTVHMLNYLPLVLDNSVLYVEANPRHILSIKRDHGAYFEEVLGHCGLSPQQVAITVPFDHLSNSYQLALAQGLQNYRSRGYQIAVKLGQTHSEQIQQATVLAMRLFPDFVKLQRAFLLDRSGQPAPALQQELTRKLVSVVRAGGGLVIQDGIETEQDAQVAEALNVHLLEGEYFEQAAARRACRAA